MNDCPPPNARVRDWIALAVLGGVVVAASGAFSAKSELGMSCFFGTLVGHAVFIAGWGAWGAVQARWRTTITFAWPTGLIALATSGMVAVVPRRIDLAEVLAAFAIQWSLFMVLVAVFVVFLLLVRLYLGLKIGVPAEATQATSQFQLRHLFCVTSLVAAGIGLGRFFFGFLVLDGEGSVTAACIMTSVLAWGLRSLLLAGVVLLPRSAWLALLVAVGTAGMATGVEAIGWSLLPDWWRPQESVVSSLVLMESVSSAWILAHFGLARWQGCRLIPDPQRLKESRLLDWVRVAAGVQWQQSHSRNEQSPLDGGGV